jgi:hypothetical protein
VPDMDFQRDKSGRIVGLEHKSDPLEGGGRGKSAIAAAGEYVRAMAEQYGLEPMLIKSLEQPVTGEFTRDEREELRLAEVRNVRSFTVVTFQQTFQGLPVWIAGVVVRMYGQDNVVTGSASSVTRVDIQIVNDPPQDRQQKAEELLRQAVENAGLYGFVVNASRDMVYRYEREQRLPSPEPGAPDPVTPIPHPAVGDVPEDIKEGSFRYVREVLFGTKSTEIGELNWRALVDWLTNAVLYLRPLVADVSGCVFRSEPISLSGNPQLDANAPVALLDAQREMLTLERLDPPGGGGIVSLAGKHTIVQDVDPPAIAPPTEPGGSAAVFCYTATNDNFAAVCAYNTHDFLYQLVEDLGFNLAVYFDGANFPVTVDHRWLNIVNAQAPGNAMGNGILRFRYSLADAGSTVGIATDARVVAHEFGHGILWDHLFSPNFGFAHSLGDALGAILFDPDSKAPDRYRSFPFNNVVLRRHDRGVASGWGWGGSMDLGGYLSEQILSTTTFRIYRSLGGDDTSLDERKHASRYTIYLMLHGVPLLSGVVPNTPEGYSSAMQESDRGTADFEGFSGGWAHKVVRWGFEKQDLYGGAPPKIDIYIDDGRAGEYPFASDLEGAPGIWNRHRADGGTNNETPRAGIENYLYVRVSSRGSEAAVNVKVRVYQARANKGRIWPDDWSILKEVAVAQPVSPKKDAIVGPIPWCPEGPCEERTLASATTKRDQSKVDTITGKLPARRLVLGDNNIAVRTFEVNRPDEDRECDAGAERRYRYSVKFVCGCTKGHVVALGKYFTAINVRNTRDESITFTKRFSVALPGERSGNVSDVTWNKLGPYEALEIDCEDIARHNRVPECCFLKGFAVIESEVELDVTVVYTAAKSDGEVETMDVETIEPRSIKKKHPTPPDDKVPPADRSKLPTSSR